MKCHCGQIVEGLVQIAFHVGLNVNELVVNDDWLQIDELDQVLEAVFEQLGLIGFKFKMN
jgi:hypothetical protein